MSEEKVEYRLAVRDRDEVLFPAWEQMQQQADVLVKSQFFPSSIKTASQALAVMMMGRELGIPPMEAIRNIHPIDGKPTCGASLMGALILRSGGTYSINESTNERCSITFTRRTGGKMYTHEFTIADAKSAGLAGKQNWQKYPKAMLFSRCLSAGARAFMPDVISGIYTPEELGAPVKIEMDDVVIDGEARVVEPEPKPTRNKIVEEMVDNWQSEHGQVDQEPQESELEPQREEPEPVKPQQEPKKTNGKHWSDDNITRGSFYAASGLNEAQVKLALNVDHLRDFAGTGLKAIKICKDWAASRATAEQEQLV